MYVLYQQGIGISNVYFLHVATILWLFISTNSIVRIRSGLDRKVAKNKTEPHSGVQHSKKLSRSLSSEAERASKKRSLRKGSKKCMSKRGLWIPAAAVHAAKAAEAAAAVFGLFYGLFCYGSWCFWQVGPANWIAVRSPMQSLNAFLCVAFRTLCHSNRAHIFLELWVELKLY